jgi:hypothetical protein
MTSSASSHDDVAKGFGLPETIDPNHTYVYRTGEYGLYQYWYQDRFENYWLYTNAPVDSEDYDQHAGEAMISPDQPMPHTSPEFFNQDGQKRNVAVPAEANLQENGNYNPSDLRNIWKEVYQAPDGHPRYVYLDKDIRENPDMWVQNQLRVVDAMVPKYRQFANNLFQGSHPKDKVFGAILMLVDQGCYSVEELLHAEVSDLEFVDQTVVLLGRKFICDLPFYDFMTSLKGTREPSEPLFVLNTVYGKNQIGLNHMASFFAGMRVSPVFLMYWNASQMYSRIVHRLAAEQVPAEELKERAMQEVSLAMNLGEEADCMVDIRLQDVVEQNYNSLGKSFARLTSDPLGVFVVLSDLTSRKPDELQFSMWIHTEPMHQTTPEEEMQLEAELGQAHEEAEAEKNPEAQPEGMGPKPSGEGASPAPGEGEAASAGQEGE